MKRIRKELEDMATEKNRDFSKKLIPTAREILGVNSPDMNKLYKRIALGEFGEPLRVVDLLGDETYEEVALQGLIISRAKNISINERKLLIEKFIPQIDNWANCDMFVTSCKFVSKNMSEIWEFIQPYLKSEKEFELRYGIITLMSYFLTDEYIDGVLSTIKSIRNDAYYVKMAVAWTVATALAKDYGKTLCLLLNRDLDRWTHNKSIQKAVESRRITGEQKNYLKTLKIK